jgi:hypothetical protein
MFCATSQSKYFLTFVSSTFDCVAVNQQPVSEAERQDRNPDLSSIEALLENVVQNISMQIGELLAK